MKGKPKSLPCKICGEIVENVGSDANHVTCWKCVNDMMRSGPSEYEPAEREINVNIKITKTKNDE